MHHPRPAIHLRSRIGPVLTQQPLTRAVSSVLSALPLAKAPRLNEPSAAPPAARTSGWPSPFLDPLVPRRLPCHGIRSRLAPSIQRPFAPRLRLAASRIVRCFGSAPLPWCQVGTLANTQNQAPSVTPSSISSDIFYLPSIGSKGCLIPSRNPLFSRWLVISRQNPPIPPDFSLLVAVSESIWCCDASRQALITNHRFLSSAPPGVMTLVPLTAAWQSTTTPLRPTSWRRA